MDDKENSKPKEGLKKTIETKGSSSEKWEIISREFTNDENGKLVPSKIVYQRTREFWLKLISAFAIVTAFVSLMFSFWYQKSQTQFQIDQQKSLLQIGVYSKCLVNLSILTSAIKVDTSFLRARRSLEFENLPLVSLFVKETKLISDLNQINDLAYACQEISLLEDSLDHIIGYQDEFMAIANHLEKFPKGNEAAKLDEKLTSFFKKIDRIRHFFYIKSSILDTDKIKSAIKIISNRGKNRRLDLEIQKDYRQCFVSSAFLKRCTDSVIYNKKNASKYDTIERDSLFGRDSLLVIGIDEMDFDDSSLKFKQAMKELHFQVLRIISDTNFLLKSN